MDAHSQYFKLLEMLETLVALEGSSIAKEDWRALAEVLREKQKVLQGLSSLKSQVNVESCDLCEILHRVERKEALACQIMDKKLDEAHQAIDSHSNTRLHWIKEIVQMHKHSPRVACLHT